MAAPARIVILTTGPLCRNPRAYKEALTLGAAGHAVTVVTVASQPQFEAVDAGLLRDAPFRKVAVDLLSPSAGARLRRFAARAATWLARRAVRAGIESARALGPAAGGLAALARAHPADLTIVHTELGLVIGEQLRQAGRRVAVDFEDWHSRDLLPAARAARPLRLLAAVETSLLRHAAYASAPSHALAAALAASAGGPVPVVITNSFPLPDLPARPRPAAPPALFWFSQTLGPRRGLEEVLDAWGRTRAPSRLALLGDAEPEFRARLAARVPATHRDRLEFLPLVPPAELPAVIARHDLGLALEDATPDSRNLTISNKILQYLGAGLGVLATDTAGQREVLAAAPAAGLLVSLADPAALAAQLDELLADPARLAALGRAARRAAEQTYCWERESGRLRDAVARALA
ncbi:MAG: glycosyltransferase [Opitutaceae bacterium]|nr:glycosyltransferase [Opitutaceae bacterium]